MEGRQPDWLPFLSYLVSAMMANIAMLKICCGNEKYKAINCTLYGWEPEAEHCGSLG